MGTQNHDLLQMGHSIRDAVSMCALLTIENARIIASVWGVEALNEALVLVEQVLRQEGAHFASLASGEYLISQKDDSGLNFSRWCVLLSSRLEGIIIEHSQQSFVVVTSLVSVRGDAEAVLARGRGVPFLHDVQRFETRVTGEVSQSRYASDMKQAAGLLNSLTDGTCQLSFASVVACDAPQVVILREMELRYPASTTEFRPVEGFRPTLERLGLSRVLDRAVLAKAISLLGANPRLRLSCNVSTLSLTPEIWWIEIFQRLRDTEVGSRLTIELAETSLIPDPEFSVELLRGLQALGCNVAMDNFGEGHARLDLCRVIAPDIIKLSGNDLQAALGNPSALDHFRSLVALAKGIAPRLVAMGAASHAALSLARMMDIPLAQGSWPDFKAPPPRTVPFSSAKLLIDERAQ